MTPSSRNRRTVTGLLLGVFVVTAVTLLRLWLASTVGSDMALVFYLMAVLVAAWVGGALAGIATALLSLIVGVVFIVGPASLGSVVSEWIRVAVFLTIAVAISLMLGRLEARTAMLRAAAIELDAQRRLVERMAFEDVMTGLGNRRAFESELEKLLARALRDGRPLTVAIADVDGLKRTNDELGHGRGDALLIAVAESLRKGCRTSDAVYRIGGDEFALLLPDTDPAEYQAVTERLVGPLGDVSAGFNETGLSMGAAHVPEDGVDAGPLVRLADARMYAAKTDA